MKDSNYVPDGSGVVMGDTKGMPDRGTGTGMNGDTYGASLNTDATNSQGSANTPSDSMDKVFNDKPTKL
jgi:hypothetical protein